MVQARNEATATPSPSYDLLCLSAKTDRSLRLLAERYAEHLEPASDFSRICHTSRSGRTHFAHRLAVWARSAEEAVASLRNYLSAGNTERCRNDVLRGPSRAPRIAFLCTGNGASYAGMGQELYRTSPIFRAMLQRCAGIVKAELGYDLLDLLYGNGNYPAEDSRHHGAIEQPALFAVQLGLAELWRSWGIEPYAVMGHSIGEVAAATIAGVLSVEQGARLVAARGRLIDSLNPKGRMVMAKCSAEQADAVLGDDRRWVSISAINAAHRVTVAGEDAAVDRVMSRLEAQGVECRPLPRLIAFHSQLIDPILDTFEEEAKRVEFGAAKCRIISTVTGKEIQADRLGPKYFRENLRRPVLFARGFESLIELGVDVVVEIGPRPTLTLLAQMILEEKRHGSGSGPGVVWATSLNRGGDWAAIMSSLAALYCGGVDVDWRAVRGGESPSWGEAPSYAFDQAPYWVEWRSSSWQPSLGGGSTTGLLGPRMDSPLPTFGAQIDLGIHPWLANQKAFGWSVIPCWTLIELALSAAQELGGEPHSVCEDLQFPHPLLVGPGERWMLQIILRASTPQQFEIFGRESGRQESWLLLATGKVVGASSGTAGTVGSVAAGAGVVETEIHVSEVAQPRWDGLRCHPILFEKVHEWMSSLLPEVRDALRVPAEIRRLEIHRGGISSARVVARLEEKQDTVRGEFVLWAKDGTPLAAVSGLRWSKLERDKVLRERGEAAVQVPSPDLGSGSFAEIAATLGDEEARIRLSATVQMMLRDVLGFDRNADLDPGRSLLGLGMDSIKALELRRRIDASVGIQLSLSSLFAAPTVDALIDSTLTQLKSNHPSTREEVEAVQGANADRDDAYEVEAL